LNNAIGKVGYDNDVDSIKNGEKREYIHIQTSKMLLRQLKPFTKAWAQHGPGPNNFKVKPKLHLKSMFSVVSHCGMKLKNIDRYTI
jgi:hypothetical protein